MIDWLTLRLLGVDAEINAGRVFSVDRDGTIEWQTHKRLEVLGSHEAAVFLRSVSHARPGEFFPGALEITGNPAKFFQGHNVFGSNDLGTIARVFALRVCELAGVELTDHARSLIDRGVIVCTRIDVTESWDFGTRPRAVAAVRSVSEFGHLRHRGRGSLLAEGTVYFGMRSRRLSAKLYSKGLELQKHTLPGALCHRDQVEAHADGLLRAEFTLRSMWLRDRGLDVVQNWQTMGVTPESVHAEMMTKLNLSDATMRDPEYLEQLPARLRLAYDAWCSGADLRAMLPARTFYRYRAQLLPHGVDLAVKRPGREESNVIPLRVVLTGKRAEVPAWAKGTPLYFEPVAA